uniref:SecY-independent transporter protein n=1 Tax=Dasya binghamiae TaxID=1896963 RepID=A0A1C8XRS0_9FLOR|nr:SecY-independent transporter protein [Dasya binghamiae]AOH77188.1 SecY-independent transporter protein [Dasya binghamiae]
MLFNFLSASWYQTQIKWIKVIILKLLFWNYISFFFINLLSILIFLTFLLYWNFKNELSSYSFFDIQLKLYDYIFWWINYNCKFLFLINLLILKIMFCNLLFNHLYIYKFLKFNKKKLIFFLLSMFFFFINEFYIIFCILIFIYIFLEIIFFYLCYKNIIWYSY